MALQWLRINGFSMKKDDLWILNMTGSHSQNLRNIVAGWPGLDKGTLFLVLHTHHSLGLQEISSFP